MVRFARGAFHDRPSQPRPNREVADSPLFDPLRAIGFDMPAIRRILGRFAAEQVQLWADVTLAAVESKGPAFFRRSPQAFFMNNIQNAARGTRTPPDWFWELRREEQRRRAELARRARPHQRSAGGERGAKRPPPCQPILDIDQPCEALTQDLLAHFLAAGQAQEDALRNARQFAQESRRARDRKAVK